MLHQNMVNKDEHRVTKYCFLKNLFFVFTYAAKFLKLIYISCYLIAVLAFVILLCVDWLSKGLNP